MAERANGVNQRCRQLGEPPVELGEGHRDAADGKGDIDATKPSLGCFAVGGRDADCSGEIVFAAVFL